MESPCTPTLRFSRADEFFCALKQEDLTAVPLVDGASATVFEGCYTTHADIKRYNRLCENSLYTAECILSLASLNGYPYPERDLEQCWKTTLFHQFHDILCGCAQHATYEEAIPVLRQNLEKLSEMITGAAGFLKSWMGAAGSDCLLLFNPLATARRELLELPLTRMDIHWIAFDGQDTPLETERTENGLLVYSPVIPPLGIALIRLRRGEMAAAQGMPPIVADAETFTVETPLYHLQILKDSGEIVTLFDKAHARYLCRAALNGWRSQRGGLNRLLYYREAPVGMSAWVQGDVEEERLVRGGEGVVLEDGALRKIIRFSYTIGDSAIEQRLVIERDNPVIRAEILADWEERGDETKGTPCLLVRFTPDIAAARGVWEIPFAAYEAPTQDAVRPGQMFSAISDGQQGVALLNDCKYGHRILGNRMDLLLIRSGWEPDPASDTGRHRMAYALYPFDGPVEESGVFSQARRLNIPVVVNADDGPVQTGRETVGAPALVKGNAVVSAFKRTEDGSGYALRLFDAFGQGDEASIRLPRTTLTAGLADLRETVQDSLAIQADGTVALKLAPYQIATVVFTVSKSE